MYDSATTKPIPQAVFGCHERLCAENVSFRAEDLYWVDAMPNAEPPIEAGWYCEPCIDELQYQLDADVSHTDTLAWYLLCRATTTELLDAIQGKKE